MLPRACNQLVLSKASPDRCVRCEHPAGAHGLAPLERKPKTTNIWADTIRPATCTSPSCRRQIYWADTVDSGKSIPFDRRPVALIKTAELGTGREKWQIDLASTHWATCPARDAFRRRR